MALPEEEQPTNPLRGGMSQNVVRSRYQTEPEAVEVPPTEPQVSGAYGRATEAGEETGGSPIAGMFGQDKPKVEKPYTMKGNIYAPTPQSELDAKQTAEKNIFEARQRAMIADYQAAGYSEKVMRDMIAIGERDAVLQRQLHDIHFARAKERMNQLYQKVDEASSLKVNPYNWHESIGRGGRVAAAFSVLTGQMAAGAGNPNSALKMMDAAIERDIAAQEQNIKNKYEAIRIARGLNQDERLLYKEEIDSLNETRAVAYSALQGRISAAKQHAINAAMYESLGVADDHYNLKKLHAINAARQNIHIEVNGHVNAASQKMMLQEIEAMQKGFVQPRTAAQAAGSDTRGQVEQLHEEVVQGQGQSSVAAAPGRAGSVAARRRPTSKPGTAPQAGAGAGTGAAAPVQDRPLGEGPLMPEEPAPEKATGKTAAGKPAARQRRETTRQEIAQYLRSEGVPAEVIRDDGYGVAYRLKQGEGKAKTTTITQAVNAINNGEEIPNGGMLMNRDADYVQQKILPPDPAQYPAGVEGAGYKAAKKLYDYGQQFEEIYETRATVDGSRNSIVAGGQIYKLAEGAPERTDVELYNKMKEKVSENATGMRVARGLAQRLRTHGLSGIFTPEGGINIPGFNTDDPTVLRHVEALITQGMQYIKKHDPTARISDQDLKVGREATAGYDSKKMRVLDFFQSFLDGNSYNNTARKTMERFIAASVIEAQRMTFEKYENSLVPSYNTLTKVNQDVNDLQLWIDTEGAR